MRSIPLALSLLLVACGAKVNFVGEGDGGGAAQGGGSGTGASISGTGGSVSTGLSCDVLSAQYEDAIRAATTCDPTLNSIQCDGTAVLNYTCGCPSILLNERNPELVLAAQQAYDAWVAGGCGPVPCGQACFPATSGGCVPSGTSGSCQVFLPE